MKGLIPNHKKVSPFTCKKALESKRDDFIEVLTDILTVIENYNWLVEKFGDGVYADVPGFCKLAGRETIEKTNWSLTPAAYGKRQVHIKRVVDVQYMWV